jgi:116 kDa U5 small nuclear ribonucleoprotein component
MALEIAFQVPPLQFPAQLTFSKQNNTLTLTLTNTLCLFFPLYYFCHYSALCSFCYSHLLSEYNIAMADEDLYDEFGNYIGPDLDDEDDDDDFDELGGGGVHVPYDDEWEDSEELQRAVPPVQDTTTVYHDTDMTNNDTENVPVSSGTGPVGTAIVLHEDKQYYDDAEDVYPDAEVLIQEEDTQPLETPIIASISSKVFEHLETELPDTTYDRKYMAGLMDTPMLVRNIAVVGHLHHGKTALMDMLVQNTHIRQWDANKEYRYTDTRFDEQKRGISIKCMPMTFVLPSLSDKSYLLNVLDTPGHVNFSDEQTAAMRLCDGVVVVVDAAEGVMVQTERALRHAVTDGLPITLVINKLDRLILELKLPPSDCYHKLNHTIEEVNAILVKCGYPHTMSPANGNVCFASALNGWCFSVQSFAKRYASTHGGSFDYEKFASKLWGDFYFSSDTRRFTRKAASSSQKRAFVQFILEPLYKIYSYTLSCQGRQLKGMLDSIGVRLSPAEARSDAKPLLRAVLQKFFVGVSCLTEMAVKHIPSPIANAKSKIEHIYSGDLNTTVGQGMTECDSSAPLMIQITKQYARPDASAFDAFGRVFSGTVRLGDRVRVMGERYTEDDSEDMSVATVTKVWILQGRYRVEVNRAPAGTWVLLEGVSDSIDKTATITAEQAPADVRIFSPLQFDTIAVMKVAIEPINPSELPKMVDGMRSIRRTYPLAVTRSEDSGERIIIGTGELYLDCILHDLRRVYSDVEIKVADPVATFRETVAETSTLQCFADSPDKKSRLTMIAEPLEAGIAEDIEHGHVRTDWEQKELSGFFMEKYDWDLLTARSIWSFGPEADGPNILLDETLPDDTDKTLLESVRSSIVHGFDWASREGPLCDEPMRNVKFRLLSANVADSAIGRIRGQIIPTSRRAAYSAFLLGTPRLMEPIFSVEIQAPADCVSAVYNVLSRRRGYVTSSAPKPGTPLYTVNAYVPVMDSFGFETDLRTHTQGQAFCLSVFDHWEIVPGDPLDKSIVFRPLEPAPMEALAREFMVKTRKRKGLSDDVSINKYFEDAMLLELAKQDAELQEYFAQQQ